MKVANFIKDNVNKDKLYIIVQDGNVLVTANPGTGKTLLLTFKYLYLLDNGYKPEDILCLTFTTKAKTELENRIIKEIKNNNLNVDLSQLKIYTFHSYALEYLDDNDVVSSNLLRFAIYDYLKKNEVLNYSDVYLLENIVPKFENLLRYLKNYGIMPSDINIENVKPLLEDYKKQSKEELDLFLGYFVDIFKYYEEIKSKNGIDYTDMLLNFLKLDIPKFKYVLVDELQDVNSIEANIVLKSCENFLVVGDKKQAIFGFQGGSISNYNLFNDSKKFILSQNFRSSQQILDYAKNLFLSKSLDKDYCNELKDLEGLKGEYQKPILYNIKDVNAICELTNTILPTLGLDEKGHQEQLAIIVRTNSQIQEISKAFKLRDCDFSVTYFSASSNAKDDLIDFLKGILSNDINDIRKALLTMFSPIKLKDALNELDLETIYSLSPEFKKMRELNVNELDRLFEEYILKLAIPYGEEYLFACLSVRKSYQEALKVIDNLNYVKLMDFLKASDLLSQEVSSKKKIVITTVHKSKGLEYKSVIYVPQEMRDKSNFQDYIVTSILKSNKIDIKEELLEESLRVDFVALTRAKQELYILTDKVENYQNDFCELKELQITDKEVKSISENSKRAFNLFLLKDYENAKKLLENNDSYLTEYIKNYFSNLDHISYSRICDDPYDFFNNCILNLTLSSPALKLGSEVHNIAEAYLLNKEFEVKNEKYFENLKYLIVEIKKDYPEFVFAEKNFSFTVKEIFGIDSSVKFNGVIDAVFKNGNNYLIVDWKTSKGEDGSKYRQQLAIYRKALSLMLGVAEDYIKVAIGYLGLLPTVNIGILDKKLDVSQPRDSAIETISKKVNIIVQWKANPDLFIKEFISSTRKEDLNNNLYLALKEQLEKEMK